MTDATEGMGSGKEGREGQRLSSARRKNNRTVHSLPGASSAGKHRLVASTGNRLGALGGTRSRNHIWAYRG